MVIRAGSLRLRWSGHLPDAIAKYTRRSLHRYQVKAYTTRVGEGPYPTEIHGALAEELREEGGEYGTTTGRPRRVGWLDIPALQYVTR